jgi:hypothetical protein
MKKFYFYFTIILFFAFSSLASPTFNHNNEKASQNSSFWQNATEITNAPYVTKIEPDLTKPVDLKFDFILTYNELVALVSNHQIVIHGFDVNNQRYDYERFTNDNIVVEGNTITLKPTRAYESSTRYELIIASGSVINAATVGSASFNHSFTTKDKTPPELTNKSENFSRPGRVYLTFSENVLPNGATATIKHASTGEVAGTATLTQNWGMELAIQFDITPYHDSLKFYIEVEGGVVTDTAGNAWDGISGTDWLVGLPDRTPPQLIQVTPNLNEAVPLDAVFTLTFDEDVKLANSWVMELSYYDDDGGGYNSNRWSVVERFEEKNVTVEGKLVRIKPTENLTLTPPFTISQHRLIINSGSVTDLAGNNFRWDGNSFFSKNFKTTNVTDVNQISNIEFNVYPNPFNEYLILSNNDLLTNVKIANIMGQIVSDINNPDSMIDTSHLINGLYLINLYTKDGIAKTLKMIKQ